MILKPKNWDAFQHYKDRSPPWIKLHKSILDDRVFMRLPTASKALAPLMWLLASENGGGEFDASIEELEFRLRMSRVEIEKGLKPLIDNGFFIVASRVLAECLQVAVPEERRGETEADGFADVETLQSRFDRFWSLYPRKQSKSAAFKAFQKLNPDEDLLGLMLDALVQQAKSPQWTKDGGEYIPHPATWLNGRRWEDGAPNSAPVDRFAGAL